MPLNFADLAMLLGGGLYAGWAYLRPIPNDWTWWKRARKVGEMLWADVFKARRAVILAAGLASWAGWRLAPREVVEVTRTVTVDRPVQFGLWPDVAGDLTYRALNGAQYPADVVPGQPRQWIYRTEARVWHHILTDAVYGSRPPPRQAGLLGAE